MVFHNTKLTFNGFYLNSLTTPYKLGNYRIIIF